MKKYKIQDRETGTCIESGLSRYEAENLILKYEISDKIEGIYQPNFYEIVECVENEN